MKILLLIVFYLSTFTAFSQLEANNWYWGNGRAVQFLPKLRVLESDTNHKSFEEAVTLSNINTGELILYSSYIYDSLKPLNWYNLLNRNHEVFTTTNPIRSHPSCSQGLLVVPDPANCFRYYIFSLDERSLPTTQSNTKTRLSYSIVEILEGEPHIISQNNLLLEDFLSEGLTGTIQSNGRDFWVVVYNFKTAQIISIPVTDKDINVGLAVYSQIHPSETSFSDYQYNIFKISPNSKKFWMYWDGEGNSLWDFDNTKGLVSNRKKLQNSSLTFCFSPNSSKAYQLIFVPIYYIGDNIEVFQIDLTDTFYTQTQITSYPSNVDFQTTSLQIAPDGKIYFHSELNKNGNGSNTPIGYLSCIEEPNKKGDSCRVVLDKLPLKNDGTSKRFQQFPNYMDYIFNDIGNGIPPDLPCLLPKAIATADTVCQGKENRYIDKSYYHLISRRWSFAGGIPTTSTDSVVTVRYATSGVHQAQLIVCNVNGYDTAVVSSYVVATPTANAGTDKTVCPNATAQLGDKPEPGNIYSWQPITNLDNPTIANPICSPSSGTTEYILTVTNSAGCVAYDTVLVTVGNIVAKVSGDTAICLGSSVQLLASGGSEYEWSPSVGLDNSTISNPIATPIITTTYTVVVSSGTCRDSAMVIVTVNPKPTANAGEDKTICTGASIEIGIPPTAGNAYSWQPTNGLNERSLSNPIASPRATAEYILTVTGVGGCVSLDTVLVTVGNISAKVSGDTAICEGSSVQLLASGGSDYLWLPSVGLSNPNIANPIANPTKTTAYKVIVSSGLCKDSANVTVLIVPPPIANAGQDTIICVGESVQIGTTVITENSYSWKPSIGLNNPSISNPIASPNQTIEYILTVTNSSVCVNYDTVKITVNPSNERIFTLTPSLITILPGQPFQTALNVPSGGNSWNVRLGYDSLVVKFGSILQTTNGINVIPTEQNGQLTLQGKGGNGNVLLSFNTILPYNSDTIFPIKLTIESAELQPCETVTSLGNLLQLGEYCGKRIRMVSSTGKNYFLTTKENGVHFGVGLSGNVRIELYDNIGSLKEVLVSGNLEAGEYGLDFDIPTGVYFCRMSAGMFERVGMVVVVR